VVTLMDVSILSKQNQNKIKTKGVASATPSTFIF
jgi:hypothetical protein